VKAEATGFSFLHRQIGPALEQAVGRHAPPAQADAFPACTPALPGRGSAPAQ
jgi:hypothetical protein